MGHSGEIGAASAARFLLDRDAIHFATFWEDAQDVIDLCRGFKGRLAVAAHNSSATVTFSGMLLLLPNKEDL